MTEETEGASAKDRFEVLKSLLKEQIKANEILKYELTQLSKLYQAVCAEKNLLVNELLNNHSNCSNAPFSTNAEASCNDDLVTGGFKRSTSADTHSVVKRSRLDAHPGKLSPPKDSPSSTGPTVSNVTQESDPWHQHDEVDEIMPSLVRPRAAASTAPCSTANSRNSNSRLQTLATHLNSSLSSTELNKNSPWQRQFNNSCSPPALTVSSGLNQMQRPAKATSLVTSSALTASGNSVSVVQRVGPAAKYLSSSDKPTTGLLSSSTLPKANLVINATLGSTAGTNPKPLLSQGTPAYRLSCSSTGQRILIQPSEHGRQIRIQQSENRITNLTEESH